MVLEMIKKIFKKEKYPIKIIKMESGKMKILDWHKERYLFILKNSRLTYELNVIGGKALVILYPPHNAENLYYTLEKVEENKKPTKLKFKDTKGVPLIRELDEGKWRLILENKSNVEHYFYMELFVVDGIVDIIEGEENGNG